MEVVRYDMWNPSSTLLEVVIHRGEPLQFNKEVFNGSILNKIETSLILMFTFWEEEPAIWEVLILSLFISVIFYV